MKDDKNLKETLSKNLKYLRELNRWTQGRCCNQIGISRSSWGSYEEGRAFPKIEYLVKICELFFVTFEELFIIDLATHKRTYTELSSEKSGSILTGKESSLLDRLLEVDLLRKENKNLKETIITLSFITEKRKYESGYSDLVSFDVVWKEVLEKSQKYDQLSRESTTQYSTT